jgi:hypothetical protein
VERFLSVGRRVTREGNQTETKDKRGCMEYEGGREGSVINLDEDAQQAGPLFYVHELHFYGIRSRPDHCYRELATDLWNT